MQTAEASSQSHRLQCDFPGRNKNTVAVLAREVFVPAHSAVVSPQWLVQLHATSRDVPCDVVAKEPQHAATRVPLHTHALANIALGCELA